MAISKNSFFSAYGFKGPGFTVDDEGNVTVKSLSSEVAISDIVSQVSDTLTTIELDVTESAGAFEISSYSGTNPTITLIKGRTYRFNLDLSSLGWNIKGSDDDLNITTGIQHVEDGTTTTGLNAHDQDAGYFEWAVPANASGYYYSNVNGAVRGDITFTDPEVTGTGSFSSLLVTGTSEFRGDVTVNADLSAQKLTLSDTTQSTSSTTGGLTVAGGLGVAKDLFIGGKVVADDFLSTKVGIPTLSSNSNLNLSAQNAITFTINDLEQGRLTTDGLTGVALKDTTVNNTVIGNETPADGTFTNLIQETTPTLKKHATTKSYVDTGDIVYSIAFGA